jgi:DNA-binding transcriptional LysR family regulator
MRDDLSGLPALLAVADKRSFTAAAAALGVTPSSVSQTIRALEERVGVRLLQRTTRQVALTEAGARFLARLRPALEEVHEAFEALGELRDRPAGLLRLALPRLGYQHFLAPKLKAFMTAYPDIQLDLDIDDAFVDIVAEGMDAGIRLGEMVQREMVAVPVSGPMRMAVVGSPTYFATRKKPKHPRELPEHDCINYRRRKLGVVYRWEFTEPGASGEAGKDFEIAVSGRLIVNDGDLMLDAALDGLGLAYLLESSVAAHLSSRRLVRVLEPFCPPFPGFFLYYPSRTHLAPKLSALVDFLRHPPAKKPRPIASRPER